MARQHHYYGGNHLHYLTASTYRRARLFDSERFRRHFVEILSDLGTRLEFKIIGYVLMPEHFHVLIWPSAQANPSQIVQSLKERTALFILKNLKENARVSWCQKMLGRLRLAPTVHGHGPGGIIIITDEGVWVPIEATIGNWMYIGEHATIIPIAPRRK